MPSKKNKSNRANLKPMVSVCTPTFNRRPFIPIMFECFRNQDYPKDRIEWIIVDDGTDKIKDLVEQSGIPQIKYFELPEKLALGAKRNYMHSKVTGSIVVYMDDDDYYPPERISHAVEMLMTNREALCAGSSEIYVYFKHIKKMMQCGPYSQSHATAGTFAFRTELLKQTKYEDHAALAEEKAFLKNYTVPFVQLDPMKTILVFSHDHNTFDKKKMLETPHPDFLKESPKTVDSFIRRTAEAHIKDFFMNRVDALLAKYEPGHPRMKPDVLVQMKEIEEERQAIMRQQQQQMQQQMGGQIMVQKPGEAPVALSTQDVVNIINQQQQQMQQMVQKIQELEAINMQLQKLVCQNMGGGVPSSSPIIPNSMFGPSPSSNPYGPPPSSNPYGPPPSSNPYGPPPTQSPIIPNPMFGPQPQAPTYGASPMPMPSPAPANNGKPTIQWLR
jgi:Glycosyl transferase family 2